MTLGQQICGRLTAKGTSCRLPVANWWWIRDDLRPRLPQSCAAHLRGEERELYTSTKAARDARRQAAEERWRATEPACWSWPIPEDLDSWQAPLEYSVGPPGDFQLPQDVVDMLVAKDRTPEGRASALLSVWQDGRCAICGSRDMRLCEDHDHISGLVRGLLCHSCNTREGMNGGEDNPFGRYRLRPPTLILGLEIRYWDPFTSEYAPDRRNEPKRDPWDNALVDLM
jgi:hypothetical protein